MSDDFDDKEMAAIRQEAEKKARELQEQQAAEHAAREEEMRKAAEEAKARAREEEALVLQKTMDEANKPNPDPTGADPTFISPADLDFLNTK